MKEFATESAYPIVSLETAWRAVAAAIRPLPPRPIELGELLGLVLAEHVCATENMPDSPSSSMDGYAVLAGDGLAERRVLAEQDAGNILDVRVGPGAAVRIMTGAVLPQGADAVIPVEDTSESDGIMRPRRTVRSGENVRPVGQDLAEGDLVLASGATIGPAEIGLLAAMGRSSARAHPRPRVMVMATGDELVPPGEPLGPGQLRDSNSFALCAAVAAAGGIPQRMRRVRDQEDALRSALRAAAAQADLVITSGGVSMGTRDLIKPLLEELGRVHFGRVAIKPGKPLTFATVGGASVFGLPGFPVSSLVCFENFCRPALRLMMGHKALWRPRVAAKLTHALRHAPDRTEFQRAVVEQRGDGYWATTTGLQASGRLLSLAGANALLRIPQGVGDLEAGATVAALLVNAPEVEGGLP